MSIMQSKLYNNSHRLFVLFVNLYFSVHHFDCNVLATDFVCRGGGLEQVGGVHIIITFYPEDESEYTQIKGRTCRQDNPGYVCFCFFSAWVHV